MGNNRDFSSEGYGNDMKSIKNYHNFLQSGEWHIHTVYTDGNNTIDEYCKVAKNKGIPLLAFTEHVRKILNYDFKEFLTDIEAAREKYNLIILSGCEAKVLPGGTLDVSDWILQQVDYPIFAFHSFPNDISLFLKSLKEVLKNPYVNTWAHPGKFLSEYNVTIPREELEKIFHMMFENDIGLEMNQKYRLPPDDWLLLANQYHVDIVRGSDVHSINNLQKAT